MRSADRPAAVRRSRIIWAFRQGISGADLAERAREQACRFGAEILVARAGVRGELSPARASATSMDGTKIIARASVCATGVDYRKLGLPNEDRFVRSRRLLRRRRERSYAVQPPGSLSGRRRQFCGPGSAAFLPAMRHGSRWWSARIRLRLTLSDYLIDRIGSSRRSKCCCDTEVTALHGDQILQAITFRNNKTGEEWAAETSWLFLCLGGVPQTQWAAEAGILCDSAGYIITGPDLMKNGKRPENWVLDRDPLRHGNQPAGGVCGRRCAARLDQALRLSGRRRGPNDRLRAPLSRGHLTVSTIQSCACDNPSATNRRPS